MNEKYFRIFISIKSLLVMGVMPRHQADKFNKDSKCLCGYFDDTIDHIIKYCDIVSDLRTQCLSEADLSKDIKTLLLRRDTTLGIRRLMKAYFDRVMEVSDI